MQDARRNLTARAAVVLIGAAAPALVMPVHAQKAWPERPLRWVVNFGAGGSSYTLARVLAPRIQETLGQPIVIEIRAGATGAIGAEYVTRQPPDGYTQLFASGALSMSPALNTRLPYDIFRDFTPIVGCSNAPQVLVVHPSLPVKTVKDLVAFARQRPDQLGWATGGIGSTGHLTGEYFARQTGLRLIHVPYKANPFAGIDVIAGHVPMMFDQLSTAAPRIRAGKVRALAVTSPRRHSLLPELPTMIESGFAGFETSVWLGLLGPAALPREVVLRTNAEVNRVLVLPEVRERMTQMGLEVFGGTAEALATRMKTDLAIARRTVEAAGIKPE